MRKPPRRPARARGIFVCKDRSYRGKFHPGIPREKLPGEFFVCIRCGMCLRWDERPVSYAWREA